jgi:uncharacterized Zn-binding protein involved in type VI secretion
MPALCRDKDIAMTGHSCTVFCPIIARPSQVFVNGRKVARPGDPLAPHTKRINKKCKNHPAQINKGSRTVFAHGIPVARVGDSADQGEMRKGSPNVFVGR